MRSFKRLTILASVLAVSIWIPVGAVADDIEVQLPSNNGDDAFRITDSDGETLMIVESGGYVGIGLPDPDAQLHVLYELKLGDPSTPAAPRIFMEDTAGGVNAMYLVGGTRDLVVGSTANPTLTLLAGAAGQIFIDSSGNVGIGTFPPAYRLDVDGDVNVTGDIRKNGTAYTHPDYVFEPDYQVMDLAELREFVAEARHLPGMPSRDDVTRDGVRLFEHNRLLLEKLEEAYLYIFELQARVDRLEKAFEARAVADE